MNAKRTRVLPRAARFLASPHRGAYRRRTESQERHACSSTPPPRPARTTAQLYRRGRRRSALVAALLATALLTTVAHAPVARADAPAAPTAADCPSVLAG